MIPLEFVDIESGGGWVSNYFFCRHNNGDDDASVNIQESINVLMSSSHAIVGSRNPPVPSSINFVFDSNIKDSLSSREQFNDVGDEYNDEDDIVAI